MAILIHLYYTGQQGSAKRIAQEMLDSGTLQAIRAEPGNLRYAYFFPMEEPETVLLMDMWEDQAALDRHHASPMMETITRLRKKYQLSMRVERYLVDSEGIPEKDKEFMVKA